MKIIPQLVPTFTSTLLTRIGLGVGVSAVAIALSSTILPKSAIAQSATNVNPLQDLKPAQNERDTFTGGLGDGSFNPFQLIHNAQLGNLRDPQEYSAQVNQNITDEATKFRLQQLQRLGIPQQVPPSNSVPTPPIKGDAATQ
jgi:hypothetical protein